VEESDAFIHEDGNNNYLQNSNAHLPD
jgi:hypothetical protein